MSDPQTLFNQILDHYKKSIGDYDEALTLYKEGKAPRPKTWYGRKGAEISIKIMESGVLHKGGLKGKKLTVSGPPDYLVYLILDLKELIDLLAKDFSAFEFHADRKKEFSRIESRFSCLLNDFDRISPYLKEYKITRGSENKLRNQLVTWKNKLLEKSNAKGPIILAGQAYYPPEHSLESYIAYQIAYFVPDAPSLTIAHRANDLLKHMGKEQVSCRTLRYIVGEYKKYLTLKRMEEFKQKTESPQNN
jgi:hypothetical protein